MQSQKKLHIMAVWSITGLMDLTVVLINSYFKVLTLERAFGAESPSDPVHGEMSPRKSGQGSQYEKSLDAQITAAWGTKPVPADIYIGFGVHGCARGRPSLETKYLTSPKFLSVNTSTSHLQCVKFCEAHPRPLPPSSEMSVFLFLFGAVRCCAPLWPAAGNELTVPRPRFDA
jgi:hypothetical protein